MVQLTSQHMHTTKELRKELQMSHFIFRMTVMYIYNIGFLTGLVFFSYMF